jgi:hypothetical protein
LNWRKGLDSPEEESDERRRQPPCHARYRFKSSATCSINELIIQAFLIKIAGLGFAQKSEESWEFVQIGPEKRRRLLEPPQSD